MTLAQGVAIIVEILFFLAFVTAFINYVRRRDPLSRDVALMFSPFAILLLALAWSQVSPATNVFTPIAAILFLAQPIIALHLVSLIRTVPRRIFILAIAGLGLALAPGLLLGKVPAPWSLGPIIALVFVEALPAVFLLLEARRRSGPGARRLGIAAVATALFAFAVLVIGVLGVITASTDLGTELGLGVALLAAFGYVVAFLPPAPIRHLWQAGPTVAYQHQLLARSGRPVDEIWAGFAELAASVTGGVCTVAVQDPDGGYALAATTAPGSGLSLDGATSDIAAPGITDRDLPVMTLPPTTLGRVVAGWSGGRFVSSTRLGAVDTAAPILVVVSSHQSLFHGSDMQLLAALGAQTAIVAERRAITAEQEALSGRLAVTVEALQVANRTKSDFLASMSHELRTPLSAILGFSDLMRQESAQDGEVRVPLEWVEHIHSGGEHLLALINDVLDLSKVEAGRMELRVETFDVAQAVTELVNGVRPLAERKNVDLSSTVVPLALSADRGRFRQIMYNLLSNAIKFTPDGGSIRVEMEEGPGEIRLAVVDTGVGIAAPDLATVFEEFRQVGADEGREGGTGLGLALARRLAEAHLGQLTVTSTVGVGSRFVLTLPRAAGLEEPTDDAAVGTRSVSPDPGDERPEILVIEDDPSALRLLREYLEPVGYAVRAASDGAAGLTMAKERRPAAIILDVLLPLVDGWEVLRRLKADDATRDVPVVMVTVVDEREIGLALGAVDYLVKPVQRDALIACIDRLGIRSAESDRAVTVLAIDDEPLELTLIAAMLADGGYRVIPANDGREALRQVREHDVDVIVCDLVMPGLDGFGVVAELKADPRTAEIPILICTAHDLTDGDKDRLRGQILGVVSKGPDAREGLRGWLTKAVGPGEGLAGGAGA